MHRPAAAGRGTPQEPAHCEILQCFSTHFVITLVVHSNLMVLPCFPERFDTASAFDCTCRSRGAALYLGHGRVIMQGIDAVLLVRHAQVIGAAPSRAGLALPCRLSPPPMQLILPNNSLSSMSLGRKAQPCLKALTQHLWCTNGMTGFASSENSCLAHVGWPCSALPSHPISYAAHPVQQLVLSSN